MRILFVLSAIAALGLGAASADPGSADRAVTQRQTLQDLRDVQDQIKSEEADVALLNEEFRGNLANNEIRCIDVEDFDQGLSHGARIIEVPSPACLKLKAKIVTAMAHLATLRSSEVRLQLSAVSDRIQNLSINDIDSGPKTPAQKARVKALYDEAQRLNKRKIELLAADRQAAAAIPSMLAYLERLQTTPRLSPAEMNAAIDRMDSHRLGRDLP